MSLMRIPRIFQARFWHRSDREIAAIGVQPALRIIGIEQIGGVDGAGGKVARATLPQMSLIT